MLQQKVIQRILGFIALFAFIVIAMGVDTVGFVNSESALLVLGVLVGNIFLGGGSIGRMYKAAVSANNTVDELIAAINDFKLARYSSVVGGFVNVGFGSCIIFQEMHDPAKIGPGMALGLIGFLYALVLYGLFLANQFVVEDHVGERNQENLMWSATVLALSALALGVGVLTFILFTLST